MLPGWATTPSMLVNYVLWVLAVLVSLYAREIRSAFGSVGKVSGSMYKQKLMYRKQFLMATHDNTYALTLYLGWALLSNVIVGFWIMAVFLAISLIFHLAWEPWYFVGGILLGRTMNVAWHLNWLTNYDSEMAKIQKVLGEESALAPTLSK
jgi:hypothetical protein